MFSIVSRRLAVVAATAALVCTGCSTPPPVSIESPPAAAGASGAPAGAASSTDPAASASAATAAPTAATAIQEMPAAQAAARLRTAKIAVTGKPEAALSWRDENTLNIILVTIEEGPRSQDAPMDTTLRAYVAAGLDQADGGRLRDLMELPDSCGNDGGWQVVPKSMTVTDHDGDGHTEATVGWAWTCRGDPGPVGVQLTTFTRGKHYRLVGEGQFRAEPLQAPFNQGIPPVKAVGNPAKAAWPSGLYNPALALFNQLYL